jgi:cytoskeletal protein CcmA (bactofilin family)
MSWQETAITIISENTKIQGKIFFCDVTRVHGTLIGEVQAQPGSTLILSETAVVEGSIVADTLFIDGYVHGTVLAKKRVVISPTGRVLGKLQTPCLLLEFGAHFEGTCLMDQIRG